MIRTYKYKYQVLLTIDMTLQEPASPVNGSPFVNRSKLIDERISLAIQDITDKVKVFAVSDPIPNDGMQFIKSMDPNLKKVIVEGICRSPLRYRDGGLSGLAWSGHLRLVASRTAGRLVHR